VTGLLAFEFQQGQGISPPHDVQFGPYPMGSLSGAHSTAVNGQNNVAHHSPSHSAQVKNEWSYTSTSSHPTPLDPEAIFPHSYLITCMCEKNVRTFAAYCMAESDLRKKIIHARSFVRFVSKMLKCLPIIGYSHQH
jgi:hypothetical protein